MGRINFSDTLEIFRRIFEEISFLLALIKYSYFCNKIFLCAISDRSLHIEAFSLNWDPFKNNLIIAAIQVLKT